MVAFVEKSRLVNLVLRSRSVSMRVPVNFSIKNDIKHVFRAFITW